ncbi:ras guanine nucleotide exchange factor domain-containing protein [Lactarius indigo]|nr:ras guanine nucleotide exchange factor domain-containing protein [Lactarius indigo]
MRWNGELYSDNCKLWLMRCLLSVLTHIHKRVAKWAELGKMKSFLKQTEIRAELDDSYRELEACSVQFNMSLHLYASTRSKELEEIRRRDHDELIEMITRFLHDKNLSKATLAHAPPEDAHSFVQAIEQELREADFGETQERELQENFFELSRWVEGLPPMADLSGNVTRTSDHPIATGGSQDIYTGEWTGQEVALAYPRNQTRAAQERFQRQVEIWRTLRHPNVLPLLGMAYISNSVYSVSPYMEFGNIMQYLKIHPEAHRVPLLSEIASATEYLHSRGIIHGDLRGTNVLLSGDGHACLADFGCARIEGVEVAGPAEALTYGSTRWLAPELMSQGNYVPTTRNTDVWSFGMLCVEIFTDNVPFNFVPNEAFVPLVILDGSLPTRPEGDVTTKGLTDAMWELMNRCWRREPESRPKMPEIRETIQNMLPTRSTSQMRRSSSLISGLHPGGPPPSFISSSRPAHTTGLTPPSASLPLPITPTRGDGPLSEQSRRGSSPVTPFHKSPIFKDMPLSSSPPSHVLSRPIPSPPNPSPLSTSLQTTQHLSTTPESQKSLSPSSLRPDWSERSLHPPFVQRSASSSSSNEVSLLLEQVYITSPSSPGSLGRPSRGESTSTGSGHSSGGNPATSSGSLLEAAARDSQTVLRRAPGGAVEAGTLEGLVDRLITDTHDRARDNEFQRLFVATYRLFTTGDDLFRILKRRFDEMGDVLRLSPNTVSIRYSILLFLRVWLSTEGEHMDRELLPSIGTFVSTVSGSDVMREVAREIVDLVGKNMDVVAAPPVSPLQPSSGHRPGPPPSPDKIKPADIALALTIIEGERYAEISQVDYVAHLRGAVSKRIEFATKVNNRLVNWIKKKILGPEDVQKRASYFRHFVLVAEECRKLQNFSSMSTIVAALQSATRASSTQLVLTRENNLSKNEKQTLRQLEELLDPRGDHRTYREALNNIKSPFVIPWLAVHLHGLKAFYDGNSLTVVVDQRPLINFARCSLLLKRIGEVQRYRAPATADLLEKHYPRQHHRRSSSNSSGDNTGAGTGAGAAALAWVKAELENAPNSISSEKFEARMKELAERERRMHETHELELRALGFGPRSPRTGTKGSSVRSPPARNASLDTTHSGWV